MEDRMESLVLATLEVSENTAAGCDPQQTDASITSGSLPSTKGLV